MRQTTITLYTHTHTYIHIRSYFAHQEDIYIKAEKWKVFRVCRECPELQLKTSQRVSRHTRLEWCRLNYTFWRQLFIAKKNPQHTHTCIWRSVQDDRRADSRPRGEVARRRCVLQLADSETTMTAAHETRRKMLRSESIIMVITILKCFHFVSGDQFGGVLSI